MQFLLALNISALLKVQVLFVTLNISYFYIFISHSNICEVPHAVCNIRIKTNSPKLAQILL